MAQGAVASLPTSNGAALTAEELREILECEKIIKIRDAVLSGTHPRIKGPPHLVGVGKSIASRNGSSPSISATRPPTQIQVGRSASGAYYDEPSSPYNRSPNNYRATTGAHGASGPAKPAKSEIDPILLEKSDDLIKAEIQLQRQRLERALREQIEQQRLSQKALLQTSESLPNFDLSEVLSKALKIVHPSTLAEIEPSVGARTSGSDSFDENTFYSSQHDTPDPSSPKDTVEHQSHAVVSADERPIDLSSTKNRVADREVVSTGASLSNVDLVTAQPHSQKQHSPPKIQPLIPQSLPQPSEMTSTNSSSTHPVSNSHATSSTADMLANMGQPVSTVQDVQTMSVNVTAKQAQNAVEDLLKQSFADHSMSPLVRAHNLSPVAPQPARVSPLALARDPPVIQQAATVDEVAPVQVTALRTHPTGISSTDSSPKGVKGPEKKKKKEKKNKRKNQSKDNGGTPDSPYIKPEPRSPSPFTVAPLPRPHKRQRQMAQYGTELNYDEPRYEEAPEVIRERVVSPQYKEYREPPSWDRYEGTRQAAVPTYRRVERDDGEYRRISSENFARPPQSPTVYALPYSASEARPVRAVSHAVIDRRVHEAPSYYRDPPIPARASVRPDPDRERSRSPIMRDRRSPVIMGPPRQPVRIVVDEYGREYIDPNSVSSRRQSVAPPSRPREAELIYERAPLRTMPARAPIDTFEEEGIIYRRSSPPLMTAPRRVVSQAEYGVPEYRSYRQREYSARPPAMAPPGEEYIQIRGAAERRQMSHFEEAPREYLPRPQSVRPEPIRYEIPRDVVGRLQSVRPDLPGREYTGSVRPEVRREMIPQPQREYSVRPVEAAPARREYFPVPESQRYFEAPGRRPAEVAFIERPREATVDLVYADDARREVYR